MIIRMSVVLRRTVEVTLSDIWITPSQVVEMSANANSQDYTHPDDHNSPTYAEVELQIL